MGNIALIFDTETGQTNRVGALIARAFPAGTVDRFSAAELSPALVDDYPAFIVGTPSLGKGKLADNWQFFLESDGLDFSGKTFASYGLGDQVGYPDEFCDGMGILHQRLVDLGGVPIGSWPTEGYRFTASQAVIGEKFCGLALDQDNQPDLTGQRIEQWVLSIAEQLLHPGALS